MINFSANRGRQAKAMKRCLGKRSLLVLLDDIHDLFGFLGIPEELAHRVFT
jgi:hypothetical protein